MAPDSQLGRSSVSTKEAMEQLKHEGTVTQGLRSLLDGITQMQLQNIRAAELHCSSAAPRMQLTPRTQRKDDTCSNTAGVWNLESLSWSRQPAEQRSVSSQGNLDSVVADHVEGSPEQHEQERSWRLSHRLRSAQRVRTQREKQLLASHAAADMVARVCASSR